LSRMTLHLYKLKSANMPQLAPGRGRITISMVRETKRLVD
jgi:hypothetical protein